MRDYLEDMWAKLNPYKSVLSHSIETSAIAHILMTDTVFQSNMIALQELVHCSKSDLESLISYLAGIHDIGKINPLFLYKNDVRNVFQKLEYHPNLIDCPFRHEIYAEKVVLPRIWNEKRRFENQNKRTSTIANLSKIIGLHHQGKIASQMNYIPGKTEEIEKWTFHQELLEDEIWNLTKMKNIEINHVKTKNVMGVCTVLLGFVVLSDWIASSSIFESWDIERNKETVQEYYNRFYEYATKKIKQSKFQDIMLPTGDSFSTIWDNISKESMRPLQQEIEKIMNEEKIPLITVIEAPMGEGKTEAGIYAAIRMGAYYEKKGFYIGLPTAATSNQMCQRVTTFLEKHGIGAARLLHSQAWLLEDEESDLCSDEEDTNDRELILQWTKPLKRGLLVPYSVGTIDQALMAALRVKYGMLRLLGMQNKVLVFDEIHAADSYQIDIMIKLLEWCKILRIPVVLMSATLPLETRRRYFEAYGISLPVDQQYPAITTGYIDGSYRITPIMQTIHQKKIEVVLLPNFKDIKTIAESLIQQVQEGGCIALIVNTVIRSQEIYLEIKRKMKNDIFLFHAQFTQKRKTEIEEEIVKKFGPDQSDRPKKAIVIATQVLEQSLDVSFDCMVTDLAPIDLIMQRSGREQRHPFENMLQKWEQQKLYVLVPENEQELEHMKVYPKVLLKKTWDYLKENKYLRYPDSMRTAIEYVYGEQNIADEIMEAWMELHMEQQYQQMMAKNGEISSPDGDWFMLYHGNTLFDDEEESSSFLAAKTRLGEPTTHIIMLPKDLYDEVKVLEQIPREKAKELLLYGVSIRTSLVQGIFDLENRELWFEGNGYLKFCKVICLENDRVILGNKELHMDSEIGFRIREV